jgi:septal ring factor EnvC (AmiA/AmiB activator)
MGTLVRRNLSPTRGVSLWPALIAVLLMVIPRSALLAQPVSDQDRERLEQLRTQIETNLQQVRKLNEQQQVAEKELAQSKKQLGAAQHKEKELIVLSNELQRRIGLKEREIVDHEQRIVSFTKKSKKRLRALYLQRRDAFSPLIMLFAVPDLVQASKGVFYSAQVRLHDQELISSLQSMKEAKRRDINVLTELLKERAQTLAALEGERKQLALQLVKQKGLVSGISSRKKASESQLRDLQQQASELELVLGKLTGGETRLPGGMAPGVPETPPEEIGQGLQAARGTLAAPVAGPIVRGFGRQGKDKLREMIFHKGVEFSAPAGSPVSAVASGQVLYVGKLPGLDVVVIVDHGKRYYTLYGRLGSVIVDAGARVDAGQRIGQCALHPQEEGSGMYFEVRKSGVAVNPEEYLAPRSKQDIRPE